MSARPEGEVVRVPRSGTERTPRSFPIMGSLGRLFGGGAAARANWSVDLRRSEMERLSKTVRMVASVPPLGPELLWCC